MHFSEPAFYKRPDRDMEPVTQTRPETDPTCFLNTNPETGGRRNMVMMVINIMRTATDCSSTYRAKLLAQHFPWIIPVFSAAPVD